MHHPEPGPTIKPEEATRSFPQDIGASALLVNILGITDDVKCSDRAGMRPSRNGRRSECRSCGRRFDDLTDPIFAGHHQPLRVWVLVLYFMGLNLSNEPIAKELDLDSDDARRMTTAPREGLVLRKPEVCLSGAVECDEVYVVAGHKGHPEAVRKKGGPAAAAG